MWATVEVFSTCEANCRDPARRSEIRLSLGLTVTTRRYQRARRLAFGAPSQTDGRPHLKGQFKLNLYVAAASHVKFPSNRFFCCECMSGGANCATEKEETSIESFLLCITYAHIDWYFPQHSIHIRASVCPLHIPTHSLPFPSCLLRIS